MKRVLYFSTATAGLDEAEVDRIVEDAQARNAQIGVTGALGFNGRNFVQILEGDSANVDALIASISADPRHSGFKVIDEKEVDARAFADWNMMRVDDLEFQHIIDAMKL